MEQLREKEKYNISFKDVFLEFIDLSGAIIDAKKNFVDEIFLSEYGICILRASWLRR